MSKTKIREVVIKESKGSFGLFSQKGDEYDFDGLSSLKKILSKEKAKILDVIKYNEPGSIYELSKILKRPFKAVYDDVKLLKRFGFIDIVTEKVKNRTRKKPKIVVDELVIYFRI